MTVTVLVPVFNKEPRIDETLSAIRKVVNPDELLLVHDVTKLELEAELRKEAAHFKKQYNADTLFRINQKGFGSGIRLGFEKAKGDLIVVSMADLCDDPETINQMIKKAEAGYDVVAASRFMPGGGVVGGTRKQGYAKLASRLVSVFSRVKCSDVSNAFKLYRKSIFQKVKPTSNWFDISMETTIKAAKAGFKIGHVPTVWKDMTGDKTNFNVRSMSKSYMKWFLYSAFTYPSALTLLIIILIMLGIGYLVFF